jgi:hypothetical protein
MKNLTQHLISAPDTQLDPSMRAHIQEEWSEKPTALEILEVLDKVIHFALGSGFVIMVLETMLNDAMLEEKTDMKTLSEKATWRNEWS